MPSLLQYYFYFNPTKGNVNKKQQFGPIDTSNYDKNQTVANRAGKAPEKRNRAQVRLSSDNAD